MRDRQQRASGARVRKCPRRVLCIWRLLSFGVVLAAGLSPAMASTPDVALSAISKVGPLSTADVVSSGYVADLMPWGPALLLMMLAATGWALWQTVQVQRLTNQLALSVQNAAAPDSASQRFLTMLSHDLRTPLNGVMGMIALVRQSGLSQRQAHLLAEAERTGSNLVGLLRDTLDWSDLEHGQAKIRQEPYRTDVLAGAIEQCLADRAQHLQLVYSLRIDPKIPEWIAGDLPRLRQSVAHLCVFFAEIVRVPRIDVILSYRGTDLVCEFDVTANATNPGGWRPHEVFGRGKGADSAFATDTIGAMMARRVLHLMGGNLTMGTPRAGVTRLSLCMPAPVAIPKRDFVRVEVRSDTTQLLVHAILDERVWQVWSPADGADQVSAVILEGGSRDSQDDVSALRQQHPSARFISLGTPAQPSLFDAVCPLPAGAASLSAALDDATNPRKAAS